VKLPDIVCFGELLIDFVATRTGPLEQAPGFLRAAGGGPANVAVAAARLGCSTRFIGTVGDDPFGRSLRETLRRSGVDVRGLHLSRRGPTPLAFVSLRHDAERDFLFYWSGTADQRVRPRDLQVGLVRSARIFHYGTVSLIHAATREAHGRALETARDVGALLSCDPNLRLNLWPSRQAARRALERAVRAAHVVKVNEEELRFLTGARSVERGLRVLGEMTGAAVVATLGARGAAYRWGSVEGESPGFAVRAVDTTGAGDGFAGGLLRQLAAAPGDLRALAPDASTLTRWMRYANAVGALATTRRGAIPAFPTASQVARFLSRG
jgi:fructokinase